jgi:hypothetical protein
MDGALAEDTRHALEQVTSIAFGLLQAVIVLFGAAVAARAMRRRVRQRLAATLAPENAKRIAENGVTLGVYGVAATLLLTLWGATWTMLLTAVSLSTLVVALGLQGALQSLVAGIFILFERPFNVGDRVRFSVHGVEGTVEEIALRTTVVRTEDGTRVIAPNSFVFTQAVYNQSPDRAVLTIITVYGAGEAGRSAAETRTLVETALAGVPGFVTGPEVMVKSRFETWRVPGLVDRIPRLGAQARQLRQAAIDQGTQVRVSWSGLSDQGVREEVVRRLTELFPDARITIRRW